MKNLKTTITKTEISPAHDDYKESYRISFGEGQFLYCYNKEVYEYIEKNKEKELTLQIGVSKNNKERIEGVEGFYPTKQEKKGFVGYKPRETTPQEIRMNALTNAIASGVDGIEASLKTACIFENYIKTGEIK